MIATLDMAAYYACLSDERLREGIRANGTLLPIVDAPPVSINWFFGKKVEFPAPVRPLSMLLSQILAGFNPSETVH